MKFVRSFKSTCSPLVPLNSRDYREWLIGRGFWWNFNWKNRLVGRPLIVKTFAVDSSNKKLVKALTSDWAFCCKLCSSTWNQIKQFPSLNREQQKCIFHVEIYRSPFCSFGQKVSISFNKNLVCIFLSKRFDKFPESFCSFLICRRW